MVASIAVQADAVDVPQTFNHSSVDADFVSRALPPPLAPTTLPPSISMRPHGAMGDGDRSGEGHGELI